MKSCLWESLRHGRRRAVNGSHARKNSKKKRELEEEEEEDRREVPAPKKGAVESKKSKKEKKDKKRHLGPKASNVKLLHCNACGTSFGTRANVRTGHLDGKRHKQNVVKREAAEKEEKLKLKEQPTLQMVLSGEAGNQKPVKRHRVRVMEALLESGIPVNAIGTPLLKELLEEKRDEKLSIGDPSDLVRDNIKNVEAKLNAELDALFESAGYHVSLFVDGNSDKDEFAIIVARVCVPPFDLDERIIHLRMFQKTLTGKQWARSPTVHECVMLFPTTKPICWKICASYESRSDFG